MIPKPAFFFVLRKHLVPVLEHPTVGQRTSLRCCHRMSSTLQWTP